MTVLIVRERAVRASVRSTSSVWSTWSMWSTPATIKAAAVAAVALTCCLAALVAVLFGRLGGEFQSVGHSDVPEVDAATGMYFALNDMDAQVANVLLADRNVAPDLAIYGRDRATADQDLQQAMVTESGDAAAQRDLRSVLDRIGTYETLAADALLTGQRAGAAAGASHAASVAYYRQATDLMRTGILPTVDALTSVSASRLNATYQAGRATVRAGIAAVAIAGALLLAALAALQLYLSRRCRRLVNPALAAASVLTVALVAMTLTRLSAEAGHLQVAKADAFDSILALTQARAVSYDANADESRYLVDPGRAARYQQAFLSKSQQIAEVGPVGLGGYDAALAAAIGAYQGSGSRVRFGGYLGAEFRNFTFPGERAAAVRALLAYQRYEDADRALRALAKHDMAAAVLFDTGTAPGQSDWAFNRYDAALSSVIAINFGAFTAAVHEGQGGAAGWDSGLPAAAGAGLAVLLLAGVRPRLAEYR